MKTGITVILIALNSYMASGQEITLKVGDKAPEITAFEWIKGRPETKFLKGKIYVVEFGATWCTPCAASIPHLNAIAAKYKDDVTLVSFFVMEPNYEKEIVKKPPYVQRVEEYVAYRGDKMSYTVAVDDASGTMENRWLRAAGRQGVPHIFVIDREGAIAWIGSNPQSLDAIIAQLKNGK